MHKVENEKLNIWVYDLKKADKTFLVKSCVYIYIKKKKNKASKRKKKQSSNDKFMYKYILKEVRKV